MTCSANSAKVRPSDSDGTKPGRSQSRRSPGAPARIHPSTDPSATDLPAVGPHCHCDRHEPRPALVGRLAWPSSSDEHAVDVGLVVGRFSRITRRTDARAPPSASTSSPVSSAIAASPVALTRLDALRRALPSNVGRFFDLRTSTRSGKQLKAQTSASEESPRSRVPYWGWSSPARTAPAQPRIGDPRGSRSGGGAATTWAWRTSSSAIPLVPKPASRRAPCARKGRPPRSPAPRPGRQSWS